MSIAGLTGCTNLSVQVFLNLKVRAKVRGIFRLSPLVAKSYCPLRTTAVSDCTHLPEQRANNSKS